FISFFLFFLMPLIVCFSFQLLAVAWIVLGFDIWDGWRYLPPNISNVETLKSVVFGWLSFFLDRTHFLLYRLLFSETFGVDSPLAWSGDLDPDLWPIY